MHNLGYRSFWSNWCPMKASLGEYLQSMRAQKGLTIQDVAKQTRIDPAYLQALEDNAFSKLPPAQIFAKAYAREYGRVLALQETEVMKRFSESAEGFYRKMESDNGSVAKRNRLGSHLTTEKHRECSRLRVMP